MTTQAIHRVAKNTGILYLRMAITVFISLYATRLTLTALGIEDFGLYNLVGGVIAMLGFLNASMASASQRFMSFAQGEGDLDKIKRIFNMSTLLHLGIAVVVVIVFEIAGYFFFNGLLNIEPDRLPIAKLVYQFMVASTLFTIISVPYEAVITSHENMLFYAIVGIIESVLKLAIALYISYGTLLLPTGLSVTTEDLTFTYSLFDNLVIYGLLMALLTILMLLVKQFYCHKKYPECEISFKKHYDKTLLKQISGFAGWSFLGSASSMLSFYGQGMVMNMFFGTAINAAQGIASQVSGQLSAFATTLMTALNPMIAKSEGSGNRLLMLKAAMLGSKVSFFLIMVFHIPFLIETSYILKLWLKNVPDFTVIFCRLLLLRILIDQLFIPLKSSISAVGNIKNYQISETLLMLFPLPITYFLFTKGYPVYALYMVFIVHSLLLALIILYFTKKNCQLSITEFFCKVIARCVSSFILVFVISLIPHYLVETGLIRLLVVTLVSFISYLIIVFFVGLTFEERLNLKKLGSVISNKLISFSFKRKLIF